MTGPDATAGSGLIVTGTVSATNKRNNKLRVFIVFRDFPRKRLIRASE